MGKDLLYCKESDKRCVRSQVHYDVFHFPEDKHYVSETIPRAVIFYLKWLLQYVDQSSISHILSQIKTLEFEWLTRDHTKHFVSWTVQKTSGSSSDTQRLYLCIVLGHLKNVTFSRKHNQIAKVCDRFLQCLDACVDSNYLSKTDLKVLENIAHILVQESSSPGWLTLAAHFYPYLGIKFLFGERHTTGINYRYDVEEYHEIVDALFENIRAQHNIDQPAHQDLLRWVLKDAPTLDDALKQFERREVHLFFADECERVDFFVKFYKEQWRDNGTRKGSIGAELVEFFHIPDNIREKLHTLLFDTLLEISKSVDQLKEQRETMFLEAILYDGTLDTDEVLQVLMELSKSKSVQRQKLVLEILDDKCFEEEWHRVLLTEKVKICKSWVVARVKNKECSSINLSGVDKVVAVYEAIHIIMHCSLNISNKSLAEEISTSVVEMILGNEDAGAVLKAFSVIENYVAVVKTCYKSHVKKVLKQAPSVIKKSREFLKECSRSDRYNNKLFFFLIRFIFVCNLLSAY